MSRRLRLILHGKAAGDPRVRAAVAAVREDGHAVDVRVTWEGGDAQRFATEAMADAATGRLDVLVAGGGDGTLNEVVSAALAAAPEPACAFGLLPLGTANDFAHAAGVPVDDLTAALRLTTERVAVPIDVGTLNDRVFVNMLTGGFGTVVTAQTDPQLKKLMGGAAYVVTGIARFAELTAYDGTFTGPDFAWSGQFLVLAIGNARQAGGGIPLCEGALVDDGLLELRILPLLEGQALKDALARLVEVGLPALDEHVVTLSTPWLEFSSAQDLHINLDGEQVVANRFRVDCRQHAVMFHLGDSVLTGAATAG